MTIAYTLPDYQITAQRELYPVTLSEIKRHLRLHNDFVDDDDYLMVLREVATQMAENYINKAISKTLNTIRIDDFNSDFIKIMEGNFLSVVDVTDSGGSSIGTVKQTSVHYDFFTIEWTASIASDPLTITFYTGFEEDQTPNVIKHAILIKIADLYDNQRSDYNWNGYADNKVFETILNAYVAMRF